MTIDTKNIIFNFDYSSNEIEDIKRCLVTLYSTKAGQQPLDREFGLTSEFIGMPLEVSKNLFALEVIEKTERYEPRVQVLDITYNENYDSGYLEPVILLGASDEDDSSEDGEEEEE
jgi:phage baseplate assembly protein W